MLRSSVAIVVAGNVGKIIQVLLDIVVEPVHGAAAYRSSLDASACTARAPHHSAVMMDISVAHAVCHKHAIAQELESHALRHTVIPAFPYRRCKTLAQAAAVDRGLGNKSRRNRQTLWGGCTDANPKLLLNDT